MSRLTLLACLLLLTPACDDDRTGPGQVEGAYTLVAVDGHAVPTEPDDDPGCCLTLSGALTLTGSTYDLRTAHRNKVNGLTFENSEQGTYTRAGRTLTFTRTGGGGEGYPYLLAPGTISDDENEVVLLYGDEGPGSNQTEATFRR